MDASTIETVWIVTLVIYLVVVAVVALLLTLIVRAAREVRAVVADIWTVGQKIANNTIHIALLTKTNHLAGQILASATNVAAATAAVKDHAAECPGCPSCVIGPEWSR